jgi:hypothetical protein
MRLQNIQAKQKRNYLLAGGAAIILLVLLALIVYQLLVVPRGKAFDFFTIWFGVRNIWQRQDPYNWSTTQSIQREMFGKVLPAEKNQQGFAYPLYIAWILGPFALLPFSTAVTIWCTLQFLALMVFPYITARAFRWAPSKAENIILALGTLLVFRYPTIAFVLGQTTIFILLGIALGLYWLNQKIEVPADIAFALTGIKPNLSVLVILSVFLWSLLTQRWKVTVGIGGTLTFLTGLSFAWQPAWLQHFVSGAQNYTAYSNLLWPFHQIEILWMGKVILVTISALTSLAIARVIIDRPSRFSLLLAFCFIILLSLAGLPQTGSYSLTLLLIPAIGFAALASDDPVVRTGTLINLISPWLYWWLATYQNIQIDQIVLPFQFALIGGWILLSNRMKKASTSPKLAYQ